jgi:branched-chain amino acid aminotransferase
MNHSNRIMPFAFFRGEIVPTQEASVSIASHSLQYGTTCFAGIRGFVSEGKAKIFRLKEHFERLSQATKILGMDVLLSWEEFSETISQLIKVNAPACDFYIRPFVFSEDIVMTPRFHDIQFALAIYMIPLTFYYDSEKGLRLMISSWRKISDAAMPTKAKAGGCYVNSSLATTEAKRCGYDDALMMDDQGFIVEASVANLFIVYKGEVIAPEVGSAMLEGITRRTVMELLKEDGIPIRTERIDRSMIYTCEELMLTGTAVQVLFGQSVDGRVISNDGSPGPICQLLREKIQCILSGDHLKSKEWVTEITYGQK